MMFVKSYSTDVEHGMWGGSDITIHLDIQCDSVQQANAFTNDIQHSFDKVRNLIPFAPSAFVLTCPKCFKTTKCFNKAHVENIGIGNDVIGGCAYCDNVFLGNSND